jgi:hypothetical protein
MRRRQQQGRMTASRMNGSMAADNARWSYLAAGAITVISVAQDSDAGRA